MTATRNDSIGRRRLRGLAGAAMATVGLAGLSLTLASPAGARSDAGTETHETMHQMMDAMHGEGTAERMHQMEGAEQMMDDCAAMMDSMSSMRGMMGNGGMMGRGPSERESS